MVTVVVMAPRKSVGLETTLTLTEAVAITKAKQSQQQQLAKLLLSNPKNIRQQRLWETPALLCCFHKDGRRNHDCCTIQPNQYTHTREQDGH